MRNNLLGHLRGVTRCLLAALLLLPGVTLNARADETREQNFNEGWKFHLGDIPEASAPGFDDSRWRLLDLPHDWSVEGAPRVDNPSGNDGGYFPTGIGWYRKTFTCGADAGKWLTSVYFGGVYMNARVYVNGHDLGVHPYGFTSFCHDLTPYLKPGENVLAVRVDNSEQRNCRWYTGSGIYRNVKLIRTPRLHFAQWGTFVHTTIQGNETQVQVETAIANEQAEPSSFVLRATVSYQGVEEASVQCPVTLEAGETRTVRLSIPLSGARLWSPDTPNLYQLTCGMEQGGEDRIEQTFGVRTIEYDARHGLRLNGQPIELSGACLHHDNGPLGAAAYRDAEWRKARLLKEAGFNAVRTSHNPPSEAFLDACDHLGLLVIDESFDGWRSAKNSHDYSTLFDQWWTKDLEAMVRRDRNHPSIFCWSIGNEIIERKSPEAVLTAHALAGYVHKFDPTRPVTSALAAWDSDWEIYDPLAAAHDIVGYNYMIHKATGDHERVPDRVMMQTESFPRDAFRNWEWVVDHPYIIGDFVWTGIDYLGESGIGRYYYVGQPAGEHYERNQFPCHGAYCGDIDLTGWRKPISHYRELLYSQYKPIYMAVREPDGYYGKVRLTSWSVWPTWESWTWPGHEGKDIEVEVYSRYPSVRLYLNDSLVGEKPTTREQQFKAVFTIPYRPGTLSAEAVGNDGEGPLVLLETAGKPVRVRLSADCSEMAADGQSLAYVVAEVIDSEGRTVPNADRLLTFELKGEGTLLATCSADLSDNTGYALPRRKTWKGRAMAIIKSGKRAGKLTLTVKGKGLKKATLDLRMSDSPDPLGTAPAVFTQACPG